jgi:hypothetical protein
MSTDRTLLEFNRRKPKLQQFEVDEILPSYFQEEYPNIISFLREYYDANHEFEIIKILDHDLLALRDLDEVSLRFIDGLFYEYALNTSSDYFSKPRVALKIINFIIKNKGNELATQLFFRLFFDQEVEISYPKDNVFIIGESPLNNELYLIQDGRRYQFLSVLIKSGLSFSQWEPLYRAFAHTAGYFLSGDVAFESVANAFRQFMPTAIIDDTDLFTFTSLASAQNTIGAFGEYYVLTDSDNTLYVSNTQQIAGYSEVTIENINAQYDDLQEFAQATSPTMDEDSDGTLKSVTTSNTIETMDTDKMLKSYIDSDGIL